MRTALTAAMVVPSTMFKVYDPPYSETLVSKLFQNFPVINMTWEAVHIKFLIRKLVFTIIPIVIIGNPPPRSSITSGTLLLLILPKSNCRSLLATLSRSDLMLALAVTNAWIQNVVTFVALRNVDLFGYPLEEWSILTRRACRNCAYAQIWS